MAAVANSVFVVLLAVISVNFSAGKLFRTHSIPVCEAGHGLAMEKETKEMVCRPYCAEGHLDADGNKELCLDMGDARAGGPDDSHKEGNRVKISEIGVYEPENKRYLMERPLEDDIKKCNQTMTDTRACVAREIACHAKDSEHCLIWRRAAYIFCSKTFCGDTYFKDCLLSHLLDDGEIVHTNETHVSSGGWESFREHAVHYDHSELAKDLKTLDSDDDSICRDEEAPAIPRCSWAMMMTTCPDPAGDDHGESHGEHVALEKDAHDEHDDDHDE